MILAMAKFAEALNRIVNYHIYCTAHCHRSSKLQSWKNNFADNSLLELFTSMEKCSNTRFHFY